MNKKKYTKNMRPETRAKIHRCAEDYLKGFKYKEIMKRRDICERTYFRYKNTTIWKEHVRGKKPLPKKLPVEFPHPDEFDSIQHAAARWYELGKPSVHELSTRLVIPVERLRKWIGAPLWEWTVVSLERKKRMQAEVEARHAEKEKTYPIWKTTSRIPEDLGKKAAFLKLCGWSDTRVARAIGRHKRTLLRWRETAQWELLLDEVMLDDLMRLMLGINRTIGGALEGLYGESAQKSVES